MKKNRMMRLASILLVCVLLSTSVISGTFAKYITTANGEDHARVAKWGVEIATTTTGLFADTYKNEAAIGNTAIGAGLSVDSSRDDGDDVVAPGTVGSTTFSVTGTPEVAVKVTFAVTVNEDVIVPKDTEVAPNNKLTSNYTPVVFTLKKSDNSVVGTGTLTQIETALEALSAEYAPNEVLDETYTLSWVWDFEGANTNNAADTYLGNVADGTVTDANTKTNIDFDFTITVEQIN